MIHSLLLQNLMSIENLLNIIEENSVLIELDDHKIIEYVCH